MVVVGGGYVAAEMSHVFGAFGTEITIVNRGPKLLATLDDDVARRFTERYSERFDVRLATQVARVERTPHGVVVHLEGEAGPGVVEAETLLIATGRMPNSDVLDVAGHDHHLGQEAVGAGVRGSVPDGPLGRSVHGRLTRRAECAPAAKSLPNVGAKIAA